MEFRTLACLAIAIGVLIAWLELAAPEGEPAPEIRPPESGESRPGRAALLPLPSAPPLPEAKVALGKRLFFDPQLSRDNTIACATCHDLARGGTDRSPVSVGIEGRTGAINAPTVFNATLNFVQFWDGRAASLEAQAAGPVHNPLEMDSSWSAVIPKLKRDQAYRSAFAAVYPASGISGDTIVDAIAAYERTLLTPSRFDRFLAGEASALTAIEQLGYQRFLDYGCASCHQGAGVGGNMFQRFGVMGDYFQGRPLKEADLGRYNVTKREEDRHVFKVPSLRNVAVTPPYFHDSSARSLEEAIAVMARYQLGRELPVGDITAIAAFLGSLTGQWEGRELQ